MMGGLGMGFGIFGLVLMVPFWCGLIALAVWLVRSLFPHTTQPPAPSRGSRSSARDILDRRYARGEINLEEYSLMKALISDESE
jgi:putative membrane protein